MYLSLGDIIIDEICSFNSNCKNPQVHVNNVHTSHHIVILHPEMGYKSGHYEYHK